MWKYNLLPVLILMSLLSCQQSKSTVGKTKSTTLLNDIWVLKTIDDQEVSKNLSQVPQIEFNIKEKTFTGNDGCNQMSGQIETLSETDLVLGPIRSTKMACRELKIANRFTTLLSTTASYDIKELNLTLKSADGKIVMTFLKID